MKHDTVVGWPWRKGEGQRGRGRGKEKGGGAGRKGRDREEGEGQRGRGGRRLSGVGTVNELYIVGVVTPLQSTHGAVLYFV